MASAGLAAQPWTSASVLSSGEWYKLKVHGEGMVKISYQDCVAAGIQPGTVPAVFGNNAGLLSYNNSDAAPDDLSNLPLMVEKGSDGIFNTGDYILFYSPGTHRWHYDSTGFTFARHYYADTAVYFITDSRLPNEIETAAVLSSYNSQSEYYDELRIHEKEVQNILKSGREWFEPVSVNLDISFDDLFTGNSYEAGENVKYRIRVLSRSEILSSFRLTSGAEVLENILLAGVNIFNTAGTYARMEYVSGEYNPLTFTEPLSLKYYNNGNSNALGWLDYLSLHSRRKLVYSNRELIFRDSKSVSEGGICEFSIDNATSALRLWDISQAGKPESVPAVYESGKLRFRVKTDSLKTFILFDPANSRGPLDISGPIANQDLHSHTGRDMIIVCPEVFRSRAEELADIHSVYNGLESYVVTLDEIYNEFSGGIPDISAIRNYIRMVYTRSKEGETKLKYLTLFGDGSYENRKLPPGNPNFVPTYQTENSNVNILSFTSDDFYGLLDEDEGEYKGYLDIGIGRLPVSDTAEAGIVLKKIRSYLNPSNAGAWRNMLLLIADDEDSNAHMSDAESLYNQVGNTAPYINTDKVYLDSYVQKSSINGDSYPAATEAINSRLNSGALIFNYIGHGSEKGLAHERVVKIEDIISWSNIDRLPVFITATCEFSRFDDIDIDPGSGEISEVESAGEMVLLSPEGGGIALLTTTRIVYSAPNYILNSKIYESAFTPDENGRGKALGDIVREAKNAAGSGDNKRNFTLLGDPALKLAWPWHGRVVTDSINGVELLSFTDTIQALSELSLSGHLTDGEGTKLPSADGEIFVTVFDKKYPVSSLANDGGSPFEFERQDRILFRGKASIENGEFRIKMFIPRDINYLYDYGKISYYARSGSADFTGYSNDILIGGFNNQISADTTGPEIRLFLNDTLFRNGGITNPRPTLLVLLSDPGGINTAGTGIGHDIVTYLDEDRANSVILNNFYENNLDTYTSGNIVYPLPELERGSHTITLRAWDNYNNSTSENLVFIVETDKGFILTDLLNYPNPVSNQTSISLGHNRPGEEFNIEINIYSSGGKLVKQIVSRQLTGGFAINPISWDGLDNGGSRLARGVYIYSVTIKTRMGESARISGRMIIL
ncbi:MAG: type IX secretion system sortase PorU [Marinilabiliaceae bacterium]|nr:type IX secretion system sortase PorU [Marinilabiliaceae bacterium]